MRPRRTARKPLPAVRAVEAELIGLARDPVATVMLVVAESLPLVVMFEGEAFLHEGRGPTGVAVYAKARPYFICDSMVRR